MILDLSKPVLFTIKSVIVSGKGGFGQLLPKVGGNRDDPGPVLSTP